MTADEMQAQLEELQNRFAQIDEEKALQKRNSFIDSDSAYFGGDKDITARIFDSFKSRGIDTDTLDKAAREGIYNELRNQLNSVVQAMNQKAEQAEQSAQMAMAEAQQIKADAQTQAAEITQQLNALQEAEGTNDVSSGMETMADLGNPNDTPMAEPSPDMSATPASEEPAPDMGAEPASESEEEPAPVSEEPVPASEEEPVAAEEQAPSSTNTVSDEACKNIESKKALGGETHAPNHPKSKELSEFQKSNLKRWRENRSSPKLKSEKTASISNGSPKVNSAKRAIINACMKQRY